MESLFFAELMQCLSKMENELYYTTRRTGMYKLH